MLPENFNLIINLQIPQFEILLNFIPNPCQYDTTAATVRTIELKSSISVASEQVLDTSI